jgi:serine protease inhibitor
VLSEFDRLSQDVELKTAQGMLVADKAFVTEDYVNMLKKYFDADVFFPSDKDVVGIVNDWVAKHTNGKIKQLLSSVCLLFSSIARFFYFLFFLFFKSIIFIVFMN